MASRFVCKWAWPKLALLGLAVLAGGCFFIWELNRTPDPVVKSQKLSRWLIILSTEQEGSASYYAAAEAIRESGTNGLPLILRMLQTKDSGARQALARVLRNQHTFHAKWTIGWDMRLAALRGLKLLGPQAESAAPRLGELMCITNFTMEATLALLQMGRPGLTEFRRALTNKEPLVRTWATVGIRQLHNETSIGWGAKPSDADWDKRLVRPLLILSADNGTRDGARGALAAIIRTDPEAALPELSKALEDADINIRAEAARLLPATFNSQKSR